MGRFTNSTYTQTVNSLAQATNAKLNNPYYKFNDKKPTEVVYYKQNREKTTLDPATGTNYQHVGQLSPIKFNKINNFVLYGMGRIELNYDVGDYGLESGEISGEAVILPNTIIPTQGDFFYVPYITEDVLFKVNHVTPDTLDNGSNFYRIGYNLELVNSREQIEEQVVEEYEFIVQNVGTDFNAFVSSSNYSLVSELESTIDRLLSYYQTFFDSSVQTFVYRYNGELMYDPYLIEFMIRTKIMSYGDEYFYVHHAAYVDRKFEYNYTKTLFYYIQNGTALDMSKISFNATATKIEDPNSLFVTRLEDYYMIDYFSNYQYITVFNPISIDVLSNVESCTYYDEDDSNYVFNILTAYLKGDTDYISSNITNIIDKLSYDDSATMYYMVPITMVILSKYIETLMS